MRLFDRIKAKITGESATSESSRSYQSIMATLVGVQLMTSFEKASQAFPTFMTDTKAAGYLFGLHDAYAQHIYGRKPDKSFPEIKASYLGLFGESAGYALFSKTAVDQEKPEFQLGMLQGGREMYAYIERGVHPFGLMNHLVFDRKQSERSLTALSKFEKTILTWDREQARIALAVIATGHGDRGPIESIFGKGATVRTAIGHLTVGNMKVLVTTMEEIYPELFDGFASEEEEEDEED